jgi:hypothetical protein
MVRAGKLGFGLAIGAPSSPCVSNAVMYHLDESAAGLAVQLAGVYTRYADDLVFSTDRVGACREFASAYEALLQSCSSPCLQLNHRKTLYMSKGTRRIVTGLFVTPEGNVSLGRRRKRYLRKLVWDFKNRRLDERQRLQLRGHLAFCLDVEPDYFNRLVVRYGSEAVTCALAGEAA